MSPVSAAAMTASRRTPCSDARTNTDWSKSGLTWSSGEASPGCGAGRPSRAARCRASRRWASSAPRAAPRAGRRRGPCSSATAKPSRTWATSRMYTVAPPTCFTGRSFSVSRTSGEELVRMLYSIGSDLRGARRQDDVLARRAPYGDVEGREPLGVERVRVEVDHDRPRLAAPRERHLRALHRRELGADEVEAVVVELLLAQRRRLERQLEDRDVGRRVADDQRRRRPRRHGSQERSG